MNLADDSVPLDQPRASEEEADPGTEGRRSGPLRRASPRPGRPCSRSLLQPTSSKTLFLRVLPAIEGLRQTLMTFSENSLLPQGSGSHRFEGDGKGVTRGTP